MKHCHAMPFGATVLEDGSVRFGLWAPAAHNVDLVLEPDGARLPMAKRGDWFELLTREAGAGSLYRYRIDGENSVPDPASRFNPSDVHGPSEVIDPNTFAWRDDAWKGRPWEEAVLYELHVGAFSHPGTFAGVKERLDHLVELGVTAIELMPVGDFPGARNWGYDDVLPFAPDSTYGRPDELKDLVQAAHNLGLMVFLDLVCNHFGPEGNYLHAYAPQFFSRRDATPWGEAINFTQRPVRDFFLHCALYWLEEYHLDGLRLDAVQTISDESDPDILVEIAEAVQRGPGARRTIHLVLENDGNEVRYLKRNSDGRPLWYAAQWNDDFHHALHLLLTGEREGYYGDYVEDPAWHVGRALTEGFSFQGEPSPYRGGRPRGQPSKMLPLAAFVNFLQTHDQVGNRAFGERIGALAEPRAVRAAAAIMLLSPSPVLLFMGEEFAASEPFLFFCDFSPELAQAVAAGRRSGFARFTRFSDAAIRAQIPDPNDVETFQRSKVDWNGFREPRHREWLKFYRDLIGLRSREIVPRLGMLRTTGFLVRDATGLTARWNFDSGHLTLIANLGPDAIRRPERPPGWLLYETIGLAKEEEHVPGWHVAWFVDDAALTKPT